MTKRKNNLILVSISEEYINYLYKHDKHVLYNKNSATNERKYIGVILSVNEHNYFAPLSSNNNIKNTYDSRLFFAIENNYSKNLGVIRFDTMIPVPAEAFKKYEFLKQADEKYKKLVLMQLRIINSSKSLDTIKRKAANIYKDHLHNRTNRYSKYNVNFTLLEKLSLTYNQASEKKDLSVKQKISGKKISF